MAPSSQGLEPPGKPGRFRSRVRRPVKRGYNRGWGCASAGPGLDAGIAPFPSLPATSRCATSKRHAGGSPCWRRAHVPTLAERQRREVHGATPRAHKSAMGQFMTNASVATFMAGMFEPRDGEFRLLDAGAGLGALTCATLDRWLAGDLGAGGMTVEAHEL